MSHLLYAAAVGALTCVGHMKPAMDGDWWPHAPTRRPLAMLLRGLLSASESRIIDAPPCEVSSKLNAAPPLIQHKCGRIDEIA